MGYCWATAGRGPLPVDRRKGSAESLGTRSWFFAGPVVTKDGILLAPVADLVRMKLTSFRMKDRAHIIDMDSVGLITPEIEQELPEALRARLEQVRKEERQSTGAE